MSLVMAAGVIVVVRLAAAAAIWWASRRLERARLDLELQGRKRVGL